MVAVTLPSSYQPWAGPYAPQPSPIHTKPKEGERAIAFPIRWGTDDAGLGSIWFNTNGRVVAAQFSQIVSIYVDNINCGANVQIIFPDTQFQLDVPANTAGWYEVNTNALNFFITNLNPVAGDNTNIQVCNFLVMPFTISQIVFNSAAIAAGAPTTNGTTVLLASGTGIITGGQVSISNNSAPLEIEISDGSSVKFAVSVGAAVPTYAAVLTIPPGANIKFVGGLNLVVAGSTSTTGVINANLTYRLL
jgi:hypothetical protein